MESHSNLKSHFDPLTVASCILANANIDVDVLRKLDDCDAIVFSREGKQMENQCMEQMGPRGASKNDLRRLWCTDEGFYTKTHDCYLAKLESQPKNRQGNQSGGERVTAEQLKQDQLRAMVGEILLFVLSLICFPVYFLSV